MQIDNNKVYSLSEIIRLQLVPGIKSYPTLHAEVLRDAARPPKQRVLDATILGEGKARVIRVKGENLKAYIAGRITSKE